jgi:hypothetical protein
MKKGLLVLLFLGLWAAAHGQVFINGQPIPDSCQYLRIQTAKRAGRYQVIPGISALPFDRRHRLSAASGTALEFDSYEALFEYLDKRGWDYLDSMVAVGAGSGGTYAYLFRRKRPDATR